MSTETQHQEPDQKTDKEKKIELIEVLNNALINSLEYDPDNELTDILQDQSIALDLAFRALLSETSKYKHSSESKIRNINMALYAQKSFQSTARTIFHIKRQESKLESERNEALASYPKYPR